MSERIEELLVAVGERHRTMAPPAGIELRLRQAARRRAMMRRMALWAGAVAAAVTLLLLVPGRQAAPAPESPVARSVPVPEVLAAPVKKARPRRRAAPVERVSPFIALAASEYYPPVEASSVLRLQLRKGELRQFGLDVSPPEAGEVVRVDLLVGGDGLARAIRFVQSSPGGAE